MEFCILFLLYYLSRNPDFAETVKPLMCKLKDSQQMLNFLNDLSKFTQTFGCFTGEEKPTPPPPPPPNREEGCKRETDEKNPQSPTVGIADEFIQQILESYLQKH